MELNAVALPQIYPKCSNYVNKCLELWEHNCFEIKPWSLVFGLQFMRLFRLKFLVLWKWVWLGGFVPHHHHKPGAALKPLKTGGVQPTPQTWHSVKKTGHIASAEFFLKYWPGPLWKTRVCLKHGLHLVPLTLSKKIVAAGIASQCANIEERAAG